MLQEFAVFLFGPETLNGPLTRREKKRLARSFGGEPPVSSHLRGLSDGSMLWAVSDQQLLCLSLSRKRPSTAHQLGSVRRVDAITGYFGAKLKIQVEGSVESLFAVDPAEGDAFVEALLERCPDVEAPEPLVPPKPAAPPLAATPPPQAAAAPAPEPAEVSPLDELAGLREKGLLSSEAYEELRRRLDAQGT